MLLSADTVSTLLAAGTTPAWLHNTILFLKVLVGFSIIIFVHELGHFLAAKWVGIRVDRFAVGFGPRLFGFRRGRGLTFGNEPEYSADELAEKGYGETDYCFKALPFGGYVKMLGQDDIIVNEETGEMSLNDDPRAFPSKSIGARMIVVSAGVVFNLLFAGLLLIAVFMMGQQQTSPVIGRILPISPAAGILQPGDRIVEVNGHPVDSFLDFQTHVVLGGQTAHMKIRRAGRLLDVDVPTAQDATRGVRALYVQAMLTTKLASDAPTVADLPGLKAGDEIVRIDGRPVANGFEVDQAFARSRGRVLRCEVRRSDPKHPGQTNTVECFARAMLVVTPAEFPPPGNTAAIVDSTHILGLLRRRAIDAVIPGDPADQAGFKRGDIIAAWGGIPNPTYGEILDNIKAHAERPVSVVVERRGEPKTLTVTPRRPFSLFGQKRPKVGLVFSVSGEEDRPVVCKCVPDTPFAAAHIPRGALLLAIDDKPVSSWFDVVNVLEAVAGRTVAVRYRADGAEQAGEVRVPSSLVNELGLPADGIVWSVDGVKRYERVAPGGRTSTFRVSAEPLALREVLRERIGKTVSVRLSRSLSEAPVEEPFAVRADNFDPWQMRIKLFFDQSLLEPQTELVSAGGNPIRAIRMSGRYVMRQLSQVYLFLSGLAQRNVSTRSVAGPVGIFKIAIQRAEVGAAELMFFLAFLSVNLAVINFLPMPVMDGGLMLFLLIEKIKGKPLSLKTQMISTMVGLAAIILIGLAVTIQDIGRFF